MERNKLLVMQCFFLIVSVIGLVIAVVVGNNIVICVNSFICIGLIVLIIVNILINKKR